MADEVCAQSVNAVVLYATPLNVCPVCCYVGTSPAIWDHTVTCYPIQVNGPRPNPSQ